MKGSKKTRVLLVVFFCLLFGVVRNADAFGQETAKKGPPSVVNFMTFIVSGYQWPNFVAQDKGFLVDENIKLNWQEVRSTPDMLRFLSTGAADIVINVPNMVVTGMEKGADVSVIGGFMDTVTSNLMAKPGIRSVRDLKGKVVASSGLNDITAIGLRRTFRAHGIKDNEWNLIVVGSSRDRFSTLMSGAIDAAALAQPFDLQAAEKGYNNVAPQSEYLKGFPWQVVAVYNSWAKKNAETVASFLRAHRRAAEWLHDAKNRDEAIEILIKRTKTPRPIAEKLYKMYMADQQTFSKDLMIPKRGLQVTLEVLAEAGDLKPPLSPVEKYTDERYYKMAFAK